MKFKTNENVHSVVSRFEDISSTKHSTSTVHQLLMRDDSEQQPGVPQQEQVGALDATTFTVAVPVDQCLSNHRCKQMDVVIPVALKDRDKLVKCVNGLFENSKTPINTLFIVAEDLCIIDALPPNIRNTRNIVVLSETIYPFSKHDIKEQLIKKQSDHEHASWYYQQLLKFYVFNAIPTICDNVLILDSDFVFIKPIDFLSSEGKCILSYGYPFQWNAGASTVPNQDIEHSHIDHARNLLENWDIMNSFSGMHHHMLFNKDMIECLFQSVEEYKKKPFWMAFIDNLDIHKWTSASEYVIYFHFVIKHFSNQIELRHLNTIDIIYDSEDLITHIVAFELLEHLIESNDVCVMGIGCHGFRNLKKRLHTMDYITEELRKTMLDKKSNYYILQLNDEGTLNVK